MQIKKVLFIITAVLLAVNAYTQENKDEILLNNPAVRIRATEAVNLMYNFKFTEAEKRFNWLKQDYTDHPLAYFLMGLSYWWKIMPNVDNTEYDETFFAYMDTAKNKAEQMGGKRAAYAEKAFFLAGSHAFTARLHAERSDWRKASFSSKKALNYLEESREYTEWSPEFLFGEGLYNYYAEWVKENYKYLRPILLFFPKGDKELGMRQLEENAQNSFYTRTEGQYWLMRMYYYEDKDEKAIELAGYLHETFPDNAYFHRYYARLCFTQGKLAQAKKESLEILNKIKSNMPGYEAVSGRYASFFLGFTYYKREKDLEKAKDYFQQCINFSQKANDEDAGYYIYSYSNLAEIADQQGETEKAIQLYKKILEITDKKEKLHKEAISYLKSKDAYDGNWWPF